MEEIKADDVQMVQRMSCFQEAHVIKMKKLIDFCAKLSTTLYTPLGWVTFVTHLTGNYV